MSERDIDHPASRIYCPPWYEPPECTSEDHERIKADAGIFAVAVTNITDWPGSDLISGECRLCHSTISLSVEITDEQRRILL